jgi:hypothetical protein
MWRRITFQQAVVILIALMLSELLVSSISAQDTDIPAETPTERPTQEPSPTPLPTATSAELPTATPTQEPSPTSLPTATSTELPTTAPTQPPAATPTDPQAEAQEITVSGVQPTMLTQGVGGVLTVSGTNFTGETAVSLNQSITLAVTSRSTDTLIASVGADVPAGVYTVEVSDPNGGTATAPTPLTIAEPTPVPQLAVTQSEPSRITAGQTGNLSMIGSNFSQSTTVRLVGFGFLSATFVNRGALTAVLPANLPAGRYTIEVSDPAYGTATAPNTLTVSAPSVTAAPTATATPVPGQPELVIGNFSANPSSIYPGGTTQLTFAVVNVGSRTAEGVVVALGDSKFSPANGQAGITLPDLSTGTSYVVTLSVTAPMDATEGSQSIPIVASSHDFSGQTYKDTVTVSVGILAKPTGASQVVLDSYRVTPKAAAPGESVLVQALFKNTGSKAASQVLVQLDSTNSVLLAGSEGNAFPIGDLPAGSSAPIVMPLVVASTAQSGAQAQSFTITYLQDSESKQSTASISLEVLEVVEASPLVLLKSYSVGQADPLQPGQQFTLQMALQNAGAVDVSDLLVTFGTIENTSASNSSSSNASSTSTTESSSTTTTPSASFAIYGSGGTVLLGDLAAGGTVHLTQDFIVSSDLTSGIQNLPITLQYRISNGTTTQQTLNARLIVIVPPRLRLSATNALDDPLTAGEESTLKLKIANVGSSKVALTEMRATGENVDISEGAKVDLDPLDADDNTTKSVTFKPQAAGSYTITVAVDYIDDLNQTQTITTTFSGKVVAAQQQSSSSAATMSAMPQAQSDNLLGRLLLGFLGFGG